MSPSALLGQPPISYNDRLVYNALLEVAPLVIKSGAKLPHVSHHSRAPSMIAGSSVAIALIVLITCSRLWVRIFRKGAFGADDAVIVPAAIGCVAYLACDIASETAGCLGKHLYNCTYQEFGWFYELAHCDFPLFYFTVFSVKISIVLQNRRMTGMTSTRWQIAHWTYLALLMCLMPICVFLNVFPCSPVGAAFTLQAIAKVSDPGTIKCLDQNAISLATRNLHIITDWLLLPVPLIIIWRLQMPVSRKIRLMLVFCVGLISSVASIVRNVLTSRVTADITYDYYTIYAWNVVDVFTATTVASLPALNGIIDAAASKLKTWGLMSSNSLFTRLRSFGTFSQDSKGYNTKLSDQGTPRSFGVGTTVGKNSKTEDNFDEPMLRQGEEIELQRPGMAPRHESAF